MYAILNVTKSYDGKTRKTWVQDERGKAMLFDSKPEAQAELDRFDGDVMYLGHNEYSNRFYVRRLNADQEYRLQTRGW